MTEQQVCFIFDEAKPQRLDKYLVAKLPDFSRSRLQDLIRDGKVRVDQQPAHKAGQVLEAGMSVEVHLPPPVRDDLVPEAIQLEIIFENPDVMVVNKPAGMVVHPSAGHTSGTLVHAALAHAPTLKNMTDEKRPGVVHRLDKETSGLVLVAKNDPAQRWLQDQFRQRKVDKIYQALVDGCPPTPTGRVETAIGRDPHQRNRMAVLPDNKGKHAVSEYFSLEEFPNHTLLEVHPITGRTHQIRLHLAFLGCPVVGDTLYGRRKSSLPLGRHFLHAQRLTITLPGETSGRAFEAPLPPELVKILEQLRNSRSA